MQVSLLTPGLIHEKFVQTLDKQNKAKQNEERLYVKYH